MAYTKQNTYTKGAKARAESVDGDFTAVQTAWQKLCEFTGFTAVKQITENAANRAFKLFGFDTNGDPALVPSDVSTRANKFLGWDADGDFALKQSSDLTGITTPGSPTANSIALWASSSQINDSGWTIDGSGNATAAGDLNMGSNDLTCATITTPTDTNLALSPNGTGDIVVEATLTTPTNTDLDLTPNGSGNVIIGKTITTPTNTDLDLSPNGTGEIDMNDKPVKRGKYEDYSETVYDHGTISSTQTVTCNLTNGNRQKITVSGSPTITIAVSNWPASGSGGTLHLIIVNGGLATAWLYPSTWNWRDGTEPEFPSSGRSRVVAYTEDGGSSDVDASYVNSFS